MRRGNLVFPTEPIDGINVEWSSCLTDSCLNRIGQVGTNLRCCLNERKTVVEKVFCLLERIAVFGILLFGDIGCVRKCLVFNGDTIKNITKFPQEKVKGCSVEDKMVDIHQQIDMLLGGDYLKTIERSFAKVEGLDKIVFVCRQIFLAHLFYWNVHNLFWIDGLHNTLFTVTKVNCHLKMMFNESIESINQSSSICSLRESYFVRNIIERCLGVLKTV